MSEVADNDPLRVLQVTDPHLFASRDAALRGCNTWESLNATIDHYLAGDWRADLVYLTGDLVQDDSRQAYRHLVTALDRLQLPVYVVPGNHDVPQLMAEALPDYRHGETLDAPGWRLIGMDSYEPGTAGGRLGGDELERLAALLDTAGARRIAIFLHHPPVDVGSAWLDDLGLADRETFLGIVRGSAAVRLIVFGHVHQAFDRCDNGLRIVGTPSSCRQFRPGSREFAVDDRPPAYRRFELFPDGAAVTELVWVNND